MDIKTLRNFITVAEKGSILKAAGELHISQPPLSKQMQALENELGVTLFVRTPRGIRLTEKGELLYKKALSLVAYSDSMIEELQEPSADTINIGIVSSATQYALPVIAEFSKISNIKFNITERDSFEHIKMLEKGLIDIALVRSPFDVSGDIQVHKLSDDCLTVVGDSCFFDSDKQYADFEMLRNAPLIIPRRWFNHINKILSDTDQKLQFRYICESNQTAISLASDKAGLAIVPGDVANASDLNTGFTARPFRHEYFQTSLYLLHSKKNHAPVSVHDFISYILKDF